MLNRLLNRQSVSLVAAALLLATQPGASCVSDTGGTSGDSSTPPRSGPPDTSGNRPDGEADPNYIPQRAAIMAEGTGEIGYTSDADGQLYVQDLKDEAIILSRRITRGQRVTVTPDANRIKVDDETASKADLKRDHTHRIYLLRDRRFEDTRRDAASNDRSNDKELPSGAQVKAEGRNRELAFKAPRDGSVYIYDIDARRVVDSVDVRSGQRFVFSPGADRVMLDGKRVLNRNFDTETNYRIYFSR